MKTRFLIWILKVAGNALYNHIDKNKDGKIDIYELKNIYLNLANLLKKVKKQDKKDKKVIQKNKNGIKNTQNGINSKNLLNNKSKKL